MNKKAQLKLEYNKIIDLLEEQASSPSGERTYFFQWMLSDRRFPDAS